MKINSQFDYDLVMNTSTFLFVVILFYIGFCGPFAPFACGLIGMMAFVRILSYFVLRRRARRKKLPK